MPVEFGKRLWASNITGLLKWYQRSMLLEWWIVCLLFIYLFTYSFGYLYIYFCVCLFVCLIICYLFVCLFVLCLMKAIRNIYMYSSLLKHLGVEKTFTRKWCNNITRLLCQLLHTYIHDGCLLVKQAWPSLTLDFYCRSWDRQWLLKPASDLHTLPQTQQTKSFGCVFPLCSPELGTWCTLRCLARPDRLLHTFLHSSHANGLMPRMLHSWLEVFQHGYADDWLGLRLTNILVHTLGIQTVTGLGRYCHLFGLLSLF